MVDQISPAVMKTKELPMKLQDVVQVVNGKKVENDIKTQAKL